MGHSSLNPGKLGTPGRGLTAKAPRERVGKQYKGTQRTRKAVHGECAVELAKWTFPIISLCREPYEAKVSRTGLTGGMGRRTVRQRALCLPSDRAALVSEVSIYGCQQFSGATLKDRGERFEIRDAAVSQASRRLA